MAPSPQAVMFVFSELMSPTQLEDFICAHWPPGVTSGHLRALLSSPPFNESPYMDLLADVATCLVLSGHQRSLVDVLEEMGVLPSTGPLPAIQVKILGFIFTLGGIFIPVILSFLFTLRVSIFPPSSFLCFSRIYCVYLSYRLSILPNKRSNKKKR
jgi:hypothetical protein